MSRFTEKGYIGWILRFIEFHGGKHPTLSSQSVSAFLSFLVDSENVAASTRNQASHKGAWHQCWGLAPVLSSVVTPLPTT